MIHSDHESLKHLKGKGKLNRQHAKWVELIETFLYIIKYKQSKENIMVDTLSKKYVFLSTLNPKMLGFKYVKVLYMIDSDFANVYNACENLAFDKFYRLNGYLFKENTLCVPMSSMHELFIREAHKGSLMMYFDVAKTLNALHEHFY